MASDSPFSHIDTSVAHAARVYDYWLGGKDNFAADRALGDAMMRAIPTLPSMARANRAYLGRAVRHLVTGLGIRQFLDIGPGIPTAGMTHEVAQEIAPESRVLYVDHDPLVLTHARALMNSSSIGQTEFIMADVQQPQKILADPALPRTLDLHQPVALLFVATLMYFHDHEDPQGMVDALLGALPSGSYLVVTHPTGDFDPEAVQSAVDAATAAGITLVPRSREGVASFFTGLELVEPGVVLPRLAARRLHRRRRSGERLVLRRGGPQALTGGHASSRKSSLMPGSLPTVFPVPPPSVVARCRSSQASSAAVRSAMRLLIVDMRFANTTEAASRLRDNANTLIMPEPRIANITSQTPRSPQSTAAPPPRERAARVTACIVATPFS